MKKNKFLTMVFIVVILAVTAAVAVIAVNNNNNQSTTQTQSSETETTASLAGSVVKSTTAKKTTESTTADKSAYIRKGVWYLVDADNEICYAFDFNTDGKAVVAYFSPENIEGFDAQYSKGEGVYEIRSNKIIFSKLPKVTGLVSLELEMKDSSILYNGKKLKHFDKINLDNALKCFE